MTTFTIIALIAFSIAMVLSAIDYFNWNNEKHWSQNKVYKRILLAFCYIAIAMLICAMHKLSKQP